MGSGMTLNAQAKAAFEQDIGWIKPKRSTPKVTVELGGTTIGGPMPATEAVPQMYAVWESMHEIAAEIQRLDDLIDRQQAWLDRNEFNAGYPEALRQMTANIETRNVLWRDELPALEKRANRIVEKMDGPELAELTKVHPWAPLGGMGLLSRFQQIAPLLKCHTAMWPNDGSVPF
jgi:hypothetical protein